MLSGEVALVFSAFPSILQHVKAGRVRMLAANTLKRSREAPDVPTVAEVTGLKDFDYPPLIGVLAPAGTSRQIVTRLSAAIADATRHPEVAQRFTALASMRSAARPRPTWRRSVSTSSIRDSSEGGAARAAVRRRSRCALGPRRR